MTPKEYQELSEKTFAYFKDRTLEDKTIDLLEKRIKITKKTSPYVLIPLTEKETILNKLKEKSKWLQKLNREIIKREINSEFKDFLKDKYILYFPLFELSLENLYHDFLLQSIKNTNDEEFKKLCLFYSETL